MMAGIDTKSFAFNFKNESEVLARITLRKSGVSSGSYASLNLSDKCGDDPMSVENNRELLAEFLGVQPKYLLFPDQRHTSRVKCVNTITEDLTEVDAIITNKPGFVLCVLTADCVPILFFDPMKRVIGAAHAGWRGTVNKIAVNVVQKMHADYGVDPQNIIIGIGPCIQQQNYEVGAEVIQAVGNLGTQYTENHMFSSERAGHAYADLQGINRELLMSVGVPENKIDILKVCTYSNPELYFSARRDGFNCGRFASVIMLK